MRFGGQKRNRQDLHDVQDSWEETIMYILLILSKIEFQISDYKFQKKMPRHGVAALPLDLNYFQLIQGRPKIVPRMLPLRLPVLP